MVKFLKTKKAEKQKEVYVPGDGHRKAMLQAIEALGRSYQELKVAEEGGAEEEKARTTTMERMDKLYEAIDEYRQRPPRTPAQPKGVPVSDELRGLIRAAYRLATKENFTKSDIPKLSKALLRVAKGYRAIAPPPALYVPMHKPSKYTHMNDRALPLEQPILQNLQNTLAANVAAEREKAEQTQAEEDKSDEDEDDSDEDDSDEDDSDEDDSDEGQSDGDDSSEDESDED
ncbi:hypothetical protein KCU67_g3752, partial [Aureobasidium melanogenum]